MRLEDENVRYSISAYNSLGTIHFWPANKKLNRHKICSLEIERPNRLLKALRTVDGLSCNIIDCPTFIKIIL